MKHPQFMRILPAVVALYALSTACVNQSTYQSELQPLRNACGHTMTREPQFFMTLSEFSQKIDELEKNPKKITFEDYSFSDVETHK